MPPVDSPRAPLDAERRAQVAALVPWAAAIARKYARRFPNLRDELRAVSLYGLVVSASRWVPGGEASLKTFASPRVEGEVKNLLDRERRRPVLTSLSSPVVTDEGDVPLGALLTADELSPDALSDAADAVDGLLADLPPRERRALTLLYTSAAHATAADLARALGVSLSTADRTLARARTLLRALGERAS